jgi:hypothetical protein
MRYGNLNVLKSSPQKGYLLCVCDCGVKVLRQRYYLTRALKEGRLISCGCRIGEWATKHGLFKSKEYRAWLNMKDRCSNPNNIRWDYYGGRGIKVCKRWRQSFEAFFADVGPAPSPAHSLDRYPDMNGNYEPNNVRWATASQQAHNRRKKKHAL